MRTFRYSLLIMSAMLPLSGCGFFQRIEQWKCDHLGMCHFGTAPSVPAPMMGVPAPMGAGGSCNQCPGCGPGGAGPAMAAPHASMYPPNPIAPPPFDYSGGGIIDPYATGR